MLAVCAVAQGWGQRSELFNRWTDYHYYGFRYENKTLLTDPVWEQIAASGKYSHLAFATFDFEHDEFWDLVDVEQLLHGAYGRQPGRGHAAG